MEFLQNETSQMVKEKRKQIFWVSKHFEQENDDIPKYSDLKKRDNKYRLHCDENGILQLPTGRELIVATKNGEAKWFIRSNLANLPKEINTFYCFYDVAYIVLDSLYSSELSRKYNRLVALGNPQIISFLHKDNGILSNKKDYISYQEQRELLSLIEKSAINDYYVRRNKKVAAKKYQEEKNISIEWNEESILKRNGYTVAEAVGLTTQERHHILENVIRRKLLTREQVISHIQRQINLKSSDNKFYGAIKKWEDDIYFLLNLMI